MAKTNVDRMREMLHRDGLTNLLKRLWTYGYNQTVRPFLPSSSESIVYYNGVPVIDTNGKIGDSLPLAGDIPLYEQPIIRNVHKYIEEGDRVVIIGAGWAVVSTVVAQQIGPDGECIAYEGSKEMVEKSRRTLEFNNVQDQVELKHTVVAENIGVWGEEGDAKRVRASELPQADVLILDCEGAERPILDELTYNPRVVIVEAHEGFEHVSSELLDRGYEIVDKELYVPSEETYVLTALS